MRVYIGWDGREALAAHKALSTLRRESRLEAEFLNADKLRDAGLLWRATDKRGPVHYDLVSNAPKSTAFAASRFLVPLLCQSGYALFVDCDVIFLRDPLSMLETVDPDAAVSVVQHEYVASSAVKMVDQVQQPYPRKNWSSVMLFRCDHPANRRLSLRDVNERPGRDLHAFYWLHDSEIGKLDAGWNWLVNEQARPPNLGIAHFTLGGPWLPGWQPAPNDNLWLGAEA